MHRLIWNQTDTVRLLFQINRKMVNKIWFSFDLIRFIKDFSVRTWWNSVKKRLVTESLVNEYIFPGILTMIAMSYPHPSSITTSTFYHPQQICLKLSFSLIRKIGHFPVEISVRVGGWRPLTLLLTLQGTLNSTVIYIYIYIHIYDGVGR